MTSDVYQLSTAQQTVKLERTQLLDDTATDHDQKLET